MASPRSSSPCGTTSFTQVFWNSRASGRRARRLPETPRRLEAARRQWPDRYARRCCDHAFVDPVMARLTKHNARMSVCSLGGDDVGHAVAVNAVGGLSQRYARQTEDAVAGAAQDDGLA